MNVGLLRLLKARYWAVVAVMAAMVLGAVLAGCGGKTAAEPKLQDVELTVSAAASLTESLTDIKKQYEAQYPNVKLTFNFGASGTLQQQIEQGAPADLFLSAGKKQMETLVEKQLIEAGTNKNLLGNELVVVTSADSSLTIAALDDLLKPEFKQLGVGTTESVPAGNYTKEALTASKLWDSLQSKLVMTKDVKQVLTYVETGNTEAGFVYKTDALASSKVKIALTIAPQTYKPIEYPIGIVKATKNKAEAEKLYQYLQSQAAKAVFLKYGFTVPN